MTKAIASYPKSEQKQVVARRLQTNTAGLGYLAAKEAEQASLRQELIAKGLIKPQGEQS